jgi:Family of unknown function (DUF5681)
MTGRPDNLKPWKPGQSGNPGGRPKKQPLTDELTQLLEQDAPNAQGKSWALVIAEALLKKARSGDVRAFSVLANRIEGKPHQSIAVDVNANLGLAERIAQARKRVQTLQDSKTTQ